MCEEDIIVLYRVEFADSLPTIDSSPIALTVCEWDFIVQSRPSVVLFYIFCCCEFYRT